jgi:DNA-binding CsgD family transcriptional regulator
VKRQILIYGLAGGLLIFLLRLTEYRFLVLEHSVEIYGGLIAILFASTGIWIGIRLTKTSPKVVIVEKPVRDPGPFQPDEERIRELHLTKRELEILGLIADGLSNREISEKLFVSENTVKTHSSRVFEKLGARRRTQAVQRGKELGILP